MQSRRPACRRLENIVWREYSYWMSKNSMRVTSKGQVTIPERMRRESGLLPGTEVQFTSGRGGVQIHKAKAQGRPTARERRLREALDQLRGSATIRMTTEEIMALTRGE
jgi:bifunctional DNA-binding transcriptional regulator/antitoxin component of YhaV-PrlF toxin-antitoxin module